MAESTSVLSWLTEIIELRKGFITWVAYPLCERHVVYFIIECGNCFSIIKSLFIIQYVWTNLQNISLNFSVVEWRCDRKVMRLISLKGLKKASSSFFHVFILLIERLTQSNWRFVVLETKLLSLVLISQKNTEFDSAKLAISF